MYIGRGTGRLLSHAQRGRPLLELKCSALSLEIAHADFEPQGRDRFESLVAEVMERFGR